MLEYLETWLLTSGLEPTPAFYISRALAFACVLLLSVLADAVAKRCLLAFAGRMVAITKTTWDDTFLRRKVLNRLAHLAPALVIYLLSPMALRGFDQAVAILTTGLLIYMLLVVVLVVDAFLNAVVDIYRTYDISRQVPIKGFVQVLKIVLFFLTGVLVISLLLDKTPIYFLSGLSALTAVLMFIFKDAILGLVAGIQLTANKMVATGDWIAMPKYGADGDVLEVTLTTVKVQNWDKTITSIPTYALISESFKNWRGMEASGGRRIKRSINLDMNTIRFCDEQMLQRFAKIQYIREYIEEKKQQLAEFNKTARVDDASLVNGRRMTNVGTFRAYVKSYLRNHPLVHQEMTLLVRQLQPTGEGLPIEIYLFSKDQAWANYEALQADLLDHIIAAIPEFDLLVFQNPSGHDFRSLQGEQKP